MSVVATDGSYYERMHDGIELSESKRRAAAARGDRVRARIRHEIHIRDHANRTTTSASKIETTADWHADNDNIVAAHVGGEQWGHRLTVMYGIAHLASVVEIIQEQLNDLRKQQSETNLLLRRIAEVLEQDISN